MLTLLLTMTLAPASAEPADLPPAPGPAEALAADDRGRGGGGGKTPPGKGQQDKGQGGKNPQKAKEPEWVFDFYAEPSAGASVYSNGGQAVTAASIGGQAGYKYKLINTPDPMWSGKTRVAGSYQTNSNGLQGIDARIGSFIGPSWGHLALSVGPDLFWNKAVGGGINLEPTTGVDAPLTASLHVKPLSLSAGVAPAWLSNEARRVDWETTESKLPGFGHEFTYRAGLGLKISSFNVSAGYSYRIVANGIQQGFSFGVRL